MTRRDRGQREVFASLHCRDNELGTLLETRGPARGHGFGSGIEAYSIRPVLVEVTKDGPLPATEGVVGERHRNWHVDADHADVDLGGEVTRSIAIARKDRYTVAVLVVVGELQAFLIALGSHHRKHGSKDLFLVDAHVGRHLVEQAAAHVKAVLVTLQAEVAAVDGELGTLLDAERNIVLDL